MPLPAENPRAIPGDNRPPDYAQEVTSRLASDYAQLAETADLQCQEAFSLPEAVLSEEDLKLFSDVVVKLRDTAGRAEGARVAEKEVFLRSGQAVDGYFSSLKEKVERAARLLQKQVSIFQKAKLEEERARRERERLERERVEREARARAEAERREAERVREAAERARRDQEEKREKAIDQEAVADVAQVDAMLATEKADEARVAAAQKPAEMTRSRFDGGRLVTMKQVPVVEITDKMQLDARTLWPFIADADALKALKAWAKTKAYKTPMDGAIIEMRDESVIR